jgi:hypothetical protein
VGLKADGLGRSAWTLALVGVVACATSTSTGDGQQEAPAREEAVATVQVELALRPQHDERARVSFPSPYAALTTSRHFDPSLPAHKIRHEILIEPEGHAAVRIDVWDDPERLPLATWFERNLAFLRNDADRIEPLQMTTASIEGLLIDHLRSPQSTTMRTALVSSGARVFRVTCLDAEDDVSHELFARVVHGLAPDELDRQEVSP